MFVCSRFTDLNRLRTATCSLLLCQTWQPYFLLFCKASKTKQFSLLLAHFQTQERVTGSLRVLYGVRVHSPIPFFGRISDKRASGPDDSPSLPVKSDMFSATLANRRSHRAELSDATRRGYHDHREHVDREPRDLKAGRRPCDFVH